MRVLFLVLLGLVGGGAIGGGAGLLVGLGLQELWQVSCFEGACGYFVGLFLLIGILAGALLGAVLMGRRAARARAT
jgi:hypothetical protein